MDWFYENNGKAVGPMPEETMRHFLRIGALNAHSRVWNEAMSEWAHVEATPLAESLPLSEPEAEPAPEPPPVVEVPAPAPTPVDMRPAPVVAQAAPVAPRPVPRPRPSVMSRVPWGIIAILVVIGTGLFFILDGPKYLPQAVTGLKAVVSGKPSTAIHAEGYFLTPAADGRKLLSVVVSVPSERWIPSQKEFEEVLAKSKEQPAGTRTREQMRRFVPQRFTLFHEDRTKSQASAFVTVSADGTSKRFMSEVVMFGTGAAGGGGQKVMPSWELGAGELPKPLRIQFDEDEPVEVPDKVVAPATGEDAALQHFEMPNINIPKIEIPSFPKMPNIPGIPK